MKSVHHQYSCEYTTSDSKGQILGKRVISGNIETNEHKQVWNGVKMVQSDGKVSPQTFMEGFSYDPAKKDALADPELFKGFPPSAIEAKDIVSDQLELHAYAALASRVKPGVSLAFPSSTEKSSNKATLSELGSAVFHGHHCQIVKFESFFNKIDFKVPEVQFVGRSHRWGEVWVEQGSSLIIQATLHEDLLGELTMGDSKDSTTMNILRTGILGLK